MDSLTKRILAAKPGEKVVDKYMDMDATEDMYQKPRRQAYSMVKERIKAAQKLPEGSEQRKRIEEEEIPEMLKGLRSWAKGAREAGKRKKDYLEGKE